MLSIPLILYLVIGPLACVLLLLGMLAGRVRMGRLLWHRTVFPSPPPRVSILIPAKDEGAGIRRCIDAVLAMDYPDFEVIAINDRSQDDTGQVLDDLAVANPRLRVIHIPQGGLPPGWLGKCHALTVGARHATGQWLLFVDSDVLVQPNALSSTLSLCFSRDYDALSILTRLECRSFIQKLMLPLLAGAWSIMHAISLTNQDSRKQNATANGQFFLIRRAAYDKVGTHQAVRNQITEDVELMRLLKAADFRTRFLLGAHLAQTHMHATLPQMFHGWARIYCGTARSSPWQILGAMFVIPACLLSAYVVLGVALLAPLPTIWALASAGHLLLLLIAVLSIYRASGQGGHQALFFPFAAGVLLAILGFSLRKCMGGQMMWRGTAITASTSPPTAPATQDSDSISGG